MGGGADAGGSGGSGGQSPGGAAGVGGTGGASGASGTGGAGGAAVEPGPPGTLDATFGNGGKTDFGALGVTGLNAFDFQSTEKVVAAGQASFSDGTKKSLVVRLDAAGSLDMTFGGGKGYGVDSNTYGNPPTGYLYRLMVQGDDKILAVPPAQVGCATLCRSVRFFPDGGTDASHQSFTFGASPARVVDLIRAANGEFALLTTDYGGDFMSLYVTRRSEAADDYIYRVKVGAVSKPGGSVHPKLAQGAAFDHQGRLNVAYAMNNETFFGAARVAADGQEDTSFSFLAKLEQGAGEALGLASDASGRLLVAGYADSVAVVARVTPTGPLDTTFGNAGLTPPVPSTRWQCVAADASERAVVVGTYDGADSQAIRIGRYGQNGFPDVTYGVEGSGFATIAQGAEVSVNMCKLDKQGRLLVAGGVRAVAGGPVAPFLARVWN